MLAARTGQVLTVGTERRAPVDVREKTKACSASSASQARAQPSAQLEALALLQTLVQQLAEGRAHSVRARRLLIDQLPQSGVGLAGGAVEGLRHAPVAAGDRVLPERETQLPDAVAQLALRASHGREGSGRLAHDCGMDCGMAPGTAEGPVLSHRP